MMFKFLWDLLAGKVLKIAFIVGVLAYIAGVSYAIYSAIKEIWIVFDSATNTLSSVLSGSSSSSVMSCFYYFLDALGFNTVLGSFMVSIFGLATMYGAVVAHMMMLRSVLFVKDMALKALE